MSELKMKSTIYKLYSIYIRFVSTLLIGVFLTTSSLQPLLVSRGINGGVSKETLAAKSLFKKDEPSPQSSSPSLTKRGISSQLVLRTIVALSSCILSACLSSPAPNPPDRVSNDKVIDTNRGVAIDSTVFLIVQLERNREEIATIQLRVRMGRGVRPAERAMLQRLHQQSAALVEQLTRLVPQRRAEWERIRNEVFGNVEEIGKRTRGEKRRYYLAYEDRIRLDLLNADIPAHVGLNQNERFILLLDLEFRVKSDSLREKIERFVPTAWELCDVGILMSLAESARSVKIQYYFLGLRRWPLGIEFKTHWPYLIRLITALNDWELAAEGSRVLYYSWMRDIVPLIRSNSPELKQNEASTWLKTINAALEQKAEQGRHALKENLPLLDPEELWFVEQELGGQDAQTLRKSFNFYQRAISMGVHRLGSRVDRYKTVPRNILAFVRENPTNEPYSVSLFRQYVREAVEIRLVLDRGRIAPTGNKDPLIALDEALTKAQDILAVYHRVLSNRQVELGFFNRLLFNVIYPFFKKWPDRVPPNTNRGSLQELNRIAFRFYNIRWEIDNEQHDLLGSFLRTLFILPRPFEQRLARLLDENEKDRIALDWLSRDSVIPIEYIARRFQSGGNAPRWRGQVLKKVRAVTTSEEVAINILLIVDWTPKTSDLLLAAIDRLYADPSLNAIDYLLAHRSITIPRVRVRIAEAVVRTGISDSRVYRELLESFSTLDTLRLMQLLPENRRVDLEERYHLALQVLERRLGLPAVSLTQRVEQRAIERFTKEMDRILRELSLSLDRMFEIKIRERGSDGDLVEGDKEVPDVLETSEPRMVIPSETDQTPSNSQPIQPEKTSNILNYLPLIFIGVILVLSNSVFLFLMGLFTVTSLSAILITWVFAKISAKKRAKLEEDNLSAPLGPKIPVQNPLPISIAL